jgi:hypothetical protein
MAMTAPRASARQAIGDDKEADRLLGHARERRGTPLSNDG